MTRAKGRKMMQQSRELDRLRHPDAGPHSDALGPATTSGAVGATANRAPAHVPAAPPAKPPNPAPQRPDRPRKPSRKPRATRRRHPKPRRNGQQTQLRRWHRIPVTARVSGLVVASGFAVAVAVGTGLPVFGHGFRPLWLAGAGSVAAVLADTARRNAFLDGVRRSRVIATAVCVAVLLGAFTYGSTNSLIINGKMYAVTSTEARAWKLVDELAADRVYLSGIDELLTLDAATARVRFRELEPARKNLESMSARWTTVTLDGLPDGRLVPAIEAVKTASYWGAQALQRKEDLLGLDDSKLKNELATYRSTFLQATQQMGPVLADVAAAYGFQVPAPAQPAQG
jgi:hypothetical protein